jgi:hypothetical protein
MAALVLGVVGAALGPKLFGALGGFIGSPIDSALVDAISLIKRKSPRLSNLNFETSTEGARRLRGIERDFAARPNRRSLAGATFAVPAIPIVLIKRETRAGRFRFPRGLCSRSAAITRRGVT